jgi:hypothetical protein
MPVQLAPTPIRGCTHPAHRNAANLPGVACPLCHGWLDRDGTVMDRATTVRRYPFMAMQIDGMAPQSLPDYGGPSAAELQKWRAGEMNRLVGALARTGLAIVFAAVALAIMVVIMIALIGSL